MLLLVARWAISQPDVLVARNRAEKRTTSSPTFLFLILECFEKLTPE
jgi:hypothetical protein